MSHPVRKLACVLRPTVAASGCVWCGSALPARRRVWCSDACRDAYLDNHFWGWARGRAIKRSGGSREATCDQCGKRVGWSGEVNHVEPRNGQGYEDGCHHHQTNLQVLCHACHVAETTRQLRERRGIPETGRPARDHFPGARPVELWGAA